MVLPLQLHGHKDGDNADGEEDGVDNLAGAVAERRPRHLPAAHRGVQPARRLAPAAHRAVVLSAGSHAVTTAAVAVAAAVVVTGLNTGTGPAPPPRPAELSSDPARHPACSAAPVCKIILLLDWFANL